MKPFELLIHDPVILCIGSVIGFSANVLSELVLCRMTPSAGHVRIQLLSIAFGAAVAFTCLVLLQVFAALPWLIWADHALTQMFIYAFFSFCFFNLITSTFGSLRVRMLREYLKRYPRPLASEELHALYSANDMLEARLHRLVAGAQIETQRGRYFAKRGLVHYIGLLFHALQKMLLGSARGSKE